MRAPPPKVMVSNQPVILTTAVTSTTNIDNVITKTTPSGLSGIQALAAAAAATQKITVAPQQSSPIKIGKDVLNILAIRLFLVVDLRGNISNQK